MPHSNRHAPRVPQITRDEWTDAVRDVFAVLEGRQAWENGSENHVIKTFAQHPTLAKSYLAFNRHLLNSSTLPIRLRQLAILRVAWTRRTQYMWASHMRLSLKLGLTPEDFEAVKSGPEAPAWSEVERAVLRAVEQLRDQSDLDDAAWNALARHFDRQQMMDFLFTVGTYILLALAFNAMRIELEPELQALARRYGAPRDMGPSTHASSEEGTADLGATPLPSDRVGLLEGLTTTRAIRRYLDEPVPPQALRAMLFAATRGPSGSNRQPFRFVVLTDGPKAIQAKQLIGDGARRIWGSKREADGYDTGSGALSDSPKARMARTMQQYVDHFERVPVLILPCLVRYRDPLPTEGASIYPACQNLLLAARALGYGGTFTGWHIAVESELRELLGIPDGTFMAGTITVGKPAGRHGPVRRRPMAELVYEESWGDAPVWAVDPPGTQHTSAGPPKPR